MRFLRLWGGTFNVLFFIPEILHKAHLPCRKLSNGARKKIGSRLQRVRPSHRDGKPYALEFLKKQRYDRRSPEQGMR